MCIGGTWKKLRIVTVPSSPQMNWHSMLRYNNNNIEGTRQNNPVTLGERVLLKRHRIGGSDCLIKT